MCVCVCMCVFLFVVVHVFLHHFRLEIYWKHLRDKCVSNISCFLLQGVQENVCFARNMSKFCLSPLAGNIGLLLVAKTVANQYLSTVHCLYTFSAESITRMGRLLIVEKTMMILEPPVFPGPSSLLQIGKTIVCNDPHLWECNKKSIKLVFLFYSPL